VQRRRRRGSEAGKEERECRGGIEEEEGKEERGAGERYGEWKE